MNECKNCFDDCLCWRHRELEHDYDGNVKIWEDFLINMTTNGRVFLVNVNMGVCGETDCVVGYASPNGAAINSAGHARFVGEAVDKAYNGGEHIQGPNQVGWGNFLENLLKLCEVANEVTQSWEGD